MARHHRGTQAANQQRNHRKYARLGKDRDADRQAHAEQALEDRPFWPFKMAVDLARLVDGASISPGRHAQRHKPHHNGRGPAAAHATHCRNAKVAIDKDVVDRDIQGQGAEPQDHAWPGFAQAITEIAQHAIQAHGGHAAGDPVQVPHAGCNQLRIDLHQVQQRFCADQDQRRTQAGDQGQPQGLAYDRADFAVGIGAKTLGDLGGGRQQNTRHQQKHWHPDRVAQCHGGQVPRADAPGHHRIDKAHGRGGDLRNDDGERQRQQRAHFGAHPCRAADSNGGGGLGHRVHRLASTGLNAQSRGLYA